MLLILSFDIYILAILIFIIMRLRKNSQKFLWPLDGVLFAYFKKKSDTKPTYGTTQQDSSKMKKKSNDRKKEAKTGPMAETEKAIVLADKKKLANLPVINEIELLSPTILV